MQDRDTRNAILQLRARGHGIRRIARDLQVSRGTVKRVLKAGTAEVPTLERQEKAEAHEAKILELYARCQGNLVRVCEELTAAGIVLAYPTLTGFCRRHGIGQEPKERTGQYTFEPGEEMQHDTSPHDVTIGGKRRRVQCASLVLCYSRMICLSCTFSGSRSELARVTRQWPPRAGRVKDGAAKRAAKPILDAPERGRTLGGERAS